MHIPASGAKLRSFGRESKRRQLHAWILQIAYAGGAMNIIQKNGPSLLVATIILTIGMRANAADDFNADWILTNYELKQGVRESEKLGSRPLRENDAVSKQPHLMGGWRIGKDGFCAALYPENLKVILGDLECVVDVVNGSLIEVRADHPYAAMRCSTVMRLRKVDPQNRNDLIGRSQTDCKNSRGSFSFSATVAYMRDGSPGLLPFATEEKKRAQRTQEMPTRAEKE